MKNWTVFHELHIRDKDELYKPDLFFVKEGKAFVLDVISQIPALQLILERCRQ